MIPLHQHPANPEWARAKVAGLPERWRARLERRWNKERYAFNPADLGAEGDATRSAAYQLASTLDSLAGTSLPLDASDAEVIERATLASQDCNSLASVFHDKPSLRAAMESACRANFVEPPAGKRMTDAGAIARMVCATWWSRQLRKVQARAVEGSAIAIGYVNRTRDLYVSNESMTRRRQQRRRNAAMLEATRARNELGQERTLAELAATSVADCVIKRNELMTRLGGFERIAKDMQHEGLFFTVTCPSAMHKWKTVDGGRVVENRKYNGTLPRAANDHLGRVLARARAALLRRGVRMYGFRIAEPNHDATPHWHCLVFFDSAWPGAVARAAYPRIAAVLRRYGLGRGDVKRPLQREFMAPHLARGLTKKAARAVVERDVHKWEVCERRRQNAEAGAKKHRVDFERIDWEKGSAAAYLAKYVSKNIDGYKVDKDLYGNDAFTSSQRVEAWASTWSIRQFQQIGGPPVGPWRELRRIAELPAGSPDFLVAAHVACNKTVRIEGGNPTVSYAHYCQAQGGMFMGRNYRIKVALEAVDGVGRYGDELPGRPVGVTTTFEQAYRDGIVSGVRCVAWLVKSVRHVWEILRQGAGQAHAGAARAWTRVNNCTQGDLSSLGGRFADSIGVKESLDRLYQFEFVGPWNVPELQREMNHA